ncbi:unnamed protein product [Acanthoscelides obtectus]|uniref:Uncharacterized protein n=1 Tax=Acanthoscelides obtectus TaxID=200917 RepID=A0A9P0NWQ3_ACAOB|nr:unnamed protein product [Acanthoscelides obtectus]CAK1642866.1 hypothetical protein AOBTE_LOCUS13252 [Acanthoscelides obtectus]
MNFYKTLKSELEERKNKGETNLKIKYVGGFPKIVNF